MSEECNIINTNISEFEQFHISLTSARSDYNPFYILLTQKGKDPVPGYSWKEKPLAFEEALTKMQEGYNIGIAATDKDGLVIIDIDDPAAFKNHSFKTTLTAKSSSRKGIHYFYYTSDPRCKITVPLEDIGELRCAWSYVVAPGSYVPLSDSTKNGVITKTIHDKINEIDVSDHDNIGKYTLINTLKPSPIIYEELPKQFTDTKEQREIEDQQILIKNVVQQIKKQSESNNSKSELYNINIENIFNIPNKDRFSSLFHDSHTGQNTSFSNNLIHCWRHNVSHTPITALSVLAGLYDCVDAGHGHKHSGAGLSRVDTNDGETMFKIWDYARKNGFINNDDIPPACATAWFALKNNLCNKEQIVDNWKMPLPIYANTIKILTGKEIKINNAKYKNILSIPNSFHNAIDGYNCTDWGNALRLIDIYGADIKYCHTMAAWYIWNTKIWEQDESGIIYQLAKKTIKEMYSFLSDIQNPDEKKKFLSHLISSENQSKIKAMIESAQNEPGIPIDYNDFDKDINLLNVDNGIVDLQTGILIPHEKNKMISKKLNINYNQEARYDRFIQFLNEIFPENPDIISFLKRFFGYSLTGHTSEQIFCIFYGHGGNGKGTLIDTIMHILGPYAKSTEPDTIVKKNMDRNSTNDLAVLKGARLVTTSEPEANAILDEGRIKRITGQDKITCRFLYKEFFEYQPEYKLVLMTNHEPIIKAQDYSIWRRVLKVPFNVSIPKEQWDLKLRDTLISESEGILKWLIEGAVEWYQSGLDVPESIRIATEEYKNELDVLGDFLTICTDYDTNSKESMKDIYELYKQWCQVTDNRIWSQKSVSNGLSERGYESKQSHGIRYKTNIKIKEPLKKNGSVEYFLTILHEQFNDEKDGYQISGTPVKLLEKKNPYRTFYNSSQSGTLPSTDNDHKNAIRYPPSADNDNFSKIWYPPSTDNDNLGQNTTKNDISNETVQTNEQSESNASGTHLLNKIGGIPQDILIKNIVKYKSLHYKLSPTVNDNFIRDFLEAYKPAYNDHIDRIKSIVKNLNETGEWNRYV